MQPNYFVALKMSEDIVETMTENYDGSIQLLYTGAIADIKKMGAAVTGACLLALPN